jgi:hypothetical protein
MTHTQTGAAVVSACLFGEPIAKWLANNSGFLFEAFLVGVFAVVSCSIIKSNRKSVKL